MVISQFSVTDGPGLLSAPDRPTTEPAMTDEISQLHQLINQALVAGRLTRLDKETIWMALFKGSCFSAEKCGMFRQLQERVWQAELHLEP